MKEATGEVSMTMVTIVAIAVIGGIIALLWPKVEGWIDQMFGKTNTFNCSAGYKYDTASRQCVKQK